MANEDKSETRPDPGNEPAGEAGPAAKPETGERPKAAIRRCGPGDGDLLALIGKATFLESYAGLVDGQAIVRHCQERQSIGYYSSVLADSAHALWLAEVEPGPAPVGYLHLAPPDLPVETRANDIEIKRIYLLSRFHGSGSGRALLEAAEEEARARKMGRLLLGVYKGNEKALRFYEKAGFEKVGERKFDVGGAVYEDWVLGREVCA